MANIIKSIGYSLGKVHTGMICYLCELFREGNKEPLTSFFNSFGLSVPPNPIPQREWNSVDLAIIEKLKENQKMPNILIEVKVDDHETGSNQENFQTIKYASRWPSCHAYLFITLGKGEYYHAPRSDRFRWIRIRDFERALKSIQTQDQIICDWLDEIKREITFQENVLKGDRSCIDEYRGGTWNIYLLGQMAEKLHPLFVDKNTYVDMRCYTYGARPDTILNFGWSQEPLYMEINYSGRLNLKMSFDAKESVDSKVEIVQNEISKINKIAFDMQPTFHSTGKIGGTKTIASFDVGLSNKDGFLECVSSFNTIRDKIFSVVDIFYGKKI